LITVGFGKLAAIAMVEGADPWHCHADHSSPS
jgi:hypothetical protein